MPVLKEALVSCSYLEVTAWKNTEAMDLKHLREKCKKHEDSAKHLKNVINLAMLGTVSKVYRGQGNKYNEKVGKK